MQRIYLDHNATTPVHPAVLEAMIPYFTAEFGNPSSAHRFGQRGRQAIEGARECVAALVGARSSEIVFTSGGTEADNAAIFGVVAHALRTQGKSAAAPPHVITTTIEHDAVLNTCRALEGRGVSVTYVPAGLDGIVSPDAIRAAIRPETALISVMRANNEIGTLQPVEEIGAIAAEAGVPFHTDAVQSAGKVPVDVNRLGVDLLSLSAHKFYGPKGAGALFVRKGTEIDPLLYGGPNERGRRAGTENVAAMVGLGKAAELARADLAEIAAHFADLRDRLEKGLLARIPGARVNGDPARRVPNTSNLMLPGVESESLVIALDLAGLACSAGAACSSGAVDPSHVLTAIGLTPAEARASLRFSVGRANTREEIDTALELIPAAVVRQRSVGPTQEMAAAQ
ncbi:MAG: cysteine desulfurase NifS [Acidobacteria bacterium]|nr:MAG: cysteine desulfurase NifS [Acidobacteriota bacterium]